METNDFYYKKYMKYKLKYLDLLNSYQADNLDSSESFNAGKIIDGGAFAAPFALEALRRVATSKTGRKTLSQIGKLATSKTGQDFIKKNIENVSKLADSDQVKKKKKKSKDKVTKSSKLKPDEISKMLDILPIKQIQPIIEILVEQPNIKKILQEFLNKNKDIKDIICNGKEEEQKEEEQKEEEQEKDSSETSLLSSFSELGANEISNMLIRLPIDQLKPMLINLIKENKEIQTFIMKDDAIKKLICTKKK
jgi:hypothetical protein